MLEAQRLFFQSGQTRSCAFRKAALRSLKTVIEQHQMEIVAALKADLGKSQEEAWLTEIALVLGEIKYQLRHLCRWSKPRRVISPLALFPSSSRILREPYGVVLVIAPWNYPFQLLMMPLIGAIAAGNCVVLKPAETARHTAELLERLVGECFSPDYIRLLRTDHAGMDRLVLEGPDYIFFTGAPEVGQHLMELAAKQWIPMTLELGGKSPCVVTAAADLAVAARRILWGKILNAGQTCVAPDHVWVEASVKADFVEACRKALVFLSGNQEGDFSSAPHYARIVTQRHWERLVRLLSGAPVLLGGGQRAEDRYLAPTLVEADLESPLMQEELFGPILPILTFDDADKLARLMQQQPKPLALYYFGNKQQGRDFVTKVPSGGVCINDVVLHLVNRHLPFGGQGKSGMGAYHGRRSFDTFSRERGVLESCRSFDLKIKYPPYTIVKTKLRDFLGL